MTLLTSEELVTSQKVYEIIKDVFKLPEHVTGFKFELKSNELPEITVSYYVKEDAWVEFSDRIKIFETEREKITASE